LPNLFFFPLHFSPLFSRVPLHASSFTLAQHAVEVAFESLF
jgi:hypothetical protein